MPKKDVQKFVNYKFGRARKPTSGTQHVPLERRYWLGYEHVHSDYLEGAQYLLPMADYFGRRLTCTLYFCKSQVVGTSIGALFGTRALEVNPGLTEAFWEFDSHIFALTLHFPRWLSPRAHAAQDRYYDMMQKYIDTGLAGFDLDGPDTEAAWEPNFGGRTVREIVRWLHRSGFHEGVAASALAMLISGLNSNTIPTTMWTIIEIVRDPSLLQAIREEIATAYVTDLHTGVRTLDPEKLVMLPLLQSVLTEVLRLNVNFNLMRNVINPVDMDGFTLRPDTVLQAPTLVAPTLVAHL